MVFKDPKVSQESKVLQGSWDQQENQARKAPQVLQQIQVPMDQADQQDLKG
jgi:hypothetical protein